MREIKAIIRRDSLSAVIHALHQIPLMPGVTVSVVQGFGRGESHQLEGIDPFGEARFAKLETVVPTPLVRVRCGRDSAGRSYRPTGRREDLRHTCRRRYCESARARRTRPEFDEEAAPVGL